MKIDPRFFRNGFCSRVWLRLENENQDLIENKDPAKQDNRSLHIW